MHDEDINSVQTIVEGSNDEIRQHFSSQDISQKLKVSTIPYQSFELV